MDDILIGYTHFLTTEMKPKSITFLHVIKSYEAADEMIEMFPEVKNRDDVEKAIKNNLQEKIDKHFSGSEVDRELLLRTGRPTEEIIKVLDSINPDLTVMGKKSGYTGSGVIPRRIMKYVPTSILFVPETSRYQLKKALVPVDFSDPSAKTVNAAVEITKEKGGAVTAQHIYNYPPRFFPNLPDEEDEKKMNRYLEEKKDVFVKKHSIPDDVEFVFSLNIDGPKMDQIYDQIVHEQADLIVAVAKAGKGIASILREDFTDKMAYYRFGVPILLMKDKEKHQGFFKSLLKKN
ncbi:MAG: universal stress protein [Balneolaceae bacterium]